VAEDEMLDIICRGVWPSALRKSERTSLASSRTERGSQEFSVIGVPFPLDQEDVLGTSTRQLAATTSENLLHFIDHGCPHHHCRRSSHLFPGEPLGGFVGS
jgi:hypothetical protein